MTLTPATARTTEGVPVFTFERESVELVVLDAEVDGQDVTEIQVQTTAYDPDDEIRPTSGQWASPTAAGAGDDAVVGYLVSGLVAGLHTLWLKYPANPETPVRKVAVIRIV